MICLDLHREPFAPTGSMAGEGFRRLLGRPKLDLIETVVRETLQNSIDAATPDNPVEVHLRYRVLSPDEAECLRHNVFRERPSPLTDASEEFESLEDTLGQERIALLDIADFNTRGLAGPTRADIASDDERADFVNFFRNIGAKRDTAQGGGTYGYGKTSLYALSRASTIIVDTQTTDGGRPVRRFMGCHLGDAFVEDVDGEARRFTGRHWWGRTHRHIGVEPADDGDAAVLAESLGFPPRSPLRTGTTIAVLSPHIEDEAGLRQKLAETVLWNFWPRMSLSTPEHRRLTVRLQILGEDQQLPVPEDCPPLDHYAAALRNIREGRRDRTKAISSRHGVTGHLAIVHGIRSRRNPNVAQPDGAMVSQAHAIALMRPVELVVKYLEGPPLPDERVEWAGVFVCSTDDEVERAFAAAEPPTHDDWLPKMLPGGKAKLIVSQTMRALKSHADTYFQPKPASGADGQGATPLAKTAALLGKLLTSASGKGPGGGGRSGGTGSRGKVAISAPRFVGLEYRDGRTVATFEAELTNDGSQPHFLLQATPLLVLDGSSTTDNDLPDDLSVSLIELSVDGTVANGDALRIENLKGVVRCGVTVPDDAAVSVRLSLGAM